MMSTSYPVVKTNSGSVKGISRKTETGKLYYSFQHIPYVQQPKGELLFKDPRPVQPWSEVLDCTKEGPPFYHFDIFENGTPKFVGSDEGLGVNVFTPNLRPWKPLPVYVWIHGGGFIQGSSTTAFYGPDLIVEKEVLMVSFNYRLGIFGFLSLKDQALGIPGNAGLKDQAMALKWIKENVSVFGGDPENITISGESAGGASVHYQMISPMTKGLFKKAISLSGSALNPWATAPSCYSKCLKRLGVALGLPEDHDEAALYKAIRECDPMQLLIHESTLLKPEEKLNSGVNMTVFLPQTEPYVSNMCFLPASPLELGRDAWTRDMDVIFGGCNNEGLLYSEFCHDEQGLAEINKNSAYLLPRDLYDQLSDSDQGKAKGAHLKNLYFGGADVTREKYFEYLTEAAFWHGIFRAIVLQRENAPGKTFLYNLNIAPSTDNPGFCGHIRKIINLQHMDGTCHGEDIPLLFKTAFGRRFNKGDDNYEAQQVFLNSCIEFVKRGNPNCQTSSRKITWEPLPKDGSDNVPCMEICRDNSCVQPLSKHDKIKVWNDLYEDKHTLI